MLEELLRNEGMEPHLIGTRNAALIGAAEHIFDLRIEIPSEAAEAATELLNRVLNDFAGNIDAVDEDEKRIFEENEEEDDDSDKEDSIRKAPKRRRRIVAAGLPFVIPGGAHFYLGRYVIGILLCVYFGFGIYLLLNGHETPGVVFYAGTIACDLLFSQLVFPRSENKMHIAAQLFIGLSAGAILFGAARTAETFSRNSSSLSSYPESEPTSAVGDGARAVVVASAAAECTASMV